MIIVLKMEAVQTSETSVNSHQSTRCCNPEDGHQQKFCLAVFVYPNQGQLLCGEKRTRHSTDRVLYSLIIRFISPRLQRPQVLESLSTTFCQIQQKEEMLRIVVYRRRG
jgi:hypothetical protein